MNKKDLKEKYKNYELSAINVVLHPHSEELYKSLFFDIFKERKSVVARKPTTMIIGSCASSNEDHSTYLKGKIFKYLEIDAKEPWYNIKEEEPAKAEDMQEVNIPDYLKPHLETFEYIFLLKEHKLVFVSKKSGKSLSPNYVEKLLQDITSSPFFKEKYESIEFTVIPDENTVKQIFNLKRIKSIEIDIRKPNPDDIQSAEEKFKNRLERQNISKVKSRLSEANNEGIKPDDETKVLMQIASTNGSVIAKGEDAAGDLKELSTKQKPLKYPHKWSYNFDNIYDSMARAARKLMNL